MKRLLKLMLIFAAVGMQGYLPVNGQTNAEKELRQLEIEWNNAIVRKDVAALERILAKEFVYIDYIGGVNRKADLIKSVKNSQATVEPFETEDVVVRIYGRTAVITGRFTQKILFKGQTFSGQFSYTDVYVKRGKRWQAVSAHSSRIPEKK